MVTCAGQQLDRMWTPVRQGKTCGSSSSLYPRRAQDSAHRKSEMQTIAQFYTFRDLTLFKSAVKVGGI